MSLWNMNISFTWSIYFVHVNSEEKFFSLRGNFVQWSIVYITYNLTPCTSSIPGNWKLQREKKESKSPNKLQPNKKQQGRVDIFDLTHEKYNRVGPYMR